jgi:heme A synthase
VKTFRALAVTGALVAYSLALLGSWTRINSAGMTCPDWPLCRGAVVPVLQGGVVLEWAHRALAGLETFVVIATIVAGWRERERIAGLGAMLAGLAVIFAVQIGLGGITIFQSNSPLSVMFHWGAAMLLIATFTLLAIVAVAAERGDDTGFARRPGTRRLALAAAWGYATMLAGAFVSSSGFGLACPSVPGCGDVFFGQTVPQALQMTHRTLAVAFLAFAVLAAFGVPRSARAATAAVRVALGLLLLQIVLGVLNVLYALPPLLREAHAANAVATFVAFVSATVLAAIARPTVERSAWADQRSRLQMN